MIKRLTQREQAIFVLCIAMIFIFAGYSGVVKPLRTKIAFTDGEIHKYQRRLNKSTDAIQRSNELEQQYNEYLSKFKQSKTDEQVMASVLSEIEGIAGELGLLISDLKPKKVKHEEYHNKFSVSLTISSELIDILRFLHTLQGQPHFFDIEETRFDKSSRRKLSTIKARLVLSKILIPE